MPLKRNGVIDLMRGLAVVLMIFLHVSAFYLDEPVTFFFWDYLHVVVPLFVFCSSYLEFDRGIKPFSLTLYFKRIKRLVIPFWGFVIFAAVFRFAIDNEINISSVLNRMFLLHVDSRDYEWLVFLFIYLAIITPLITRLRNITTLFVIGTISFLSTIATLLYPDFLPFRFIMWLPWTFFVVMVLLLHRHHKAKWYIPTMTGIMFVVFFTLRFLLETQNISLIFVDHKYPPDLLYLSYGVFWTYMIFIFFQKFSASIPQQIVRLLTFLSTHSYSLFFVHFFLLTYVLQFRKVYEFGVVINTTILMIAAILVQLLLNIVLTHISFFGGRK